MFFGVVQGEVIEKASHYRGGGSRVPFRECERLVVESLRLGAPPSKRHTDARLLRALISSTPFGTPGLCQIWMALTDNGLGLCGASFSQRTVPRLFKLMATWTEAGPKTF